MQHMAHRFTNIVQAWYQQHQRDLPWRHTSDAYIIWMSEIILQQTRVEQGIPYFLSLCRGLPYPLPTLAAAPDDEVMKNWQGLGYYSRPGTCLPLHAEVVAGETGRFPDTYDAIRSLKGIGDYTAAAIASFAYNLPHAVVDGNVNRLLARYFGITEPVNSTLGKKQVNDIADTMLDKDHPGRYNQSVMEFGALQCKPRNPDCGICPLREDCYAYTHNMVDQLPAKTRKGVVKTRYFHYLLMEQGDKVRIRKRPEGDIWQDLYEFPLIETTEDIDESRLLQLPELHEQLPQQGSYTWERNGLPGQTPAYPPHHTGTDI